MVQVEGKLKVAKIEKIKYPEYSNYSESVCLSNNKIYIPVNDASIIKTNRLKGGLYSLDLSELSGLSEFENSKISMNGNKSTFSCLNYLYSLFRQNAKEYKLHLEFLYPNIKDVILGGKVNALGDVFVGCNTYNDTILVYCLKTKLYKYIKLIGCPNDVCFAKDERSVFVVMNIEHATYCGLLIELNIETEETKYILGNTADCIKQFDLYSVSGIGLHDDILYIATLPELYTIDTRNYHDVKTLIGINDNVDCPLYDNITFYSDCDSNKTSINVAVFAYNQTTTYTVYKNENILKRVICCFSGCFGIGFCTKVNIDRRMNHSKIKFIAGKVDEPSLTFGTPNYEYLTVNKYFKDFDNEVTQVTQIAHNKYIFTNYKARYVLLVTM